MKVFRFCVLSTIWLPAFAIFKRNYFLTTWLATRKFIATGASQKISTDAFSVNTARCRKLKSHLYWLWISIFIVAVITQNRQQILNVMKQTIAIQNGKEMQKGPKGYINLQVSSLYSFEKNKNRSRETLLLSPPAELGPFCSYHQVHSTPSIRISKSESMDDFIRLRQQLSMGLKQNKCFQPVLRHSTAQCTRGALQLGK